jgi:hypothetical protein
VRRKGKQQVSDRYLEAKVVEFSALSSKRLPETQQGFSPVVNPAFRDVKESIAITCHAMTLPVPRPAAVGPKQHAQGAHWS